MRSDSLLPGSPWPLGATVVEGGVNFAVASTAAEAIELCLFDLAGHEAFRLPLPERSGPVVHGFVPHVRPGQAYGYRAYGRWAPVEGLCFDPAKLLLDPYARAVTGRFAWTPAHRGGEAGRNQDTASAMLKAVVTEPDAPLPFSGPGTAWAQTLIYEAHVKGLTARHPSVPEHWRGTYLGLAQPAVLDHLVTLGITAIELLPVWAFLDERRLAGHGLVNYWGYNPVAFMAPEPRYALADPVAELRAAIQALHAAGIEVILDVVLNHTAESDALGPTLSLRGLDNAAYYRLGPDGDWTNHTGTGNTLDLSKPLMLQLAMDALRHWAVAYGVDGFRFDLGTVPGRDRQDRFDPDSPFLQALRQDPLLGRLKLIAEPWDIGPGGYRLGSFPHPFAEWNDRFRDPVRRFWRGDEGMVPDLARGLLGSADLFEASGRAPQASINFITSHDGFTLADLGSFAQRRNEANGEGNRDGHADNHSLNHGVEGPSDDPAIRAARGRHRRNLLATLLLAQGTPMLLMGDELGHSQNGNNNAYCQDNPTSWIDWGRVDERLLAFVRQLTALRRSHPVLRRRHFLHGQRQDGSGLPDVTWFAEDGRTMTPGRWQDPHRRCLGLLLAGRAGPDHAPDGRLLEDSDLLLLLNAAPEAVTFKLPEAADATRWQVLLDTTGQAEGASLAQHVVLAACSLLVLEAR
jgi:glycogen operon protein